MWACRHCGSSGWAWGTGGWAACSPGHGASPHRPGHEGRSLQVEIARVIQTPAVAETEVSTTPQVRSVATITPVQSFSVA